jgi:hypothetical protein
VVRVLLATTGMKTISASTCVISVLIGLLLASPAAAQGVGVRAGASGDPDQFYAGVHVEAGPAVDRLWFRPNLELGIGDDITTTALNFEFAYKLDVRRSAWHPYLGGGPALNLYRFHGNTDAQGGFNILLGLQHARGFFTEFKVGFADSPSVKFGVGYVFPR